MKDNETGLTSRIIAKKYRNGKKIMTVVVDYYDEFGTRKQKSKETNITLEQYQRDSKRKVEIIRQDFVKQVAREQNYIDDELFNPDKLTLFKFFENFQERRKGIISIIH